MTTASVSTRLLRSLAHRVLRRLACHEPLDLARGSRSFVEGSEAFDMARAESNGPAMSEPAASRRPRVSRMETCWRRDREMLWGRVGRPPSPLRGYGETAFALSVACQPKHHPRVMRAEGERRLAEREGFEPSVEFPLHTLSKRAPSTTRTSLRLSGINSLAAGGDPRKTKL